MKVENDTDRPDTFEPVLEQERLWNASWLNLARPAALPLFLIPHVVLEGMTAGAWVLCGYGVCAVGLYLVARRVARIARWSALAVPFLDMPAVFLKQWWDMDLPWANGRAIAGFTLGIFIMLIMLSAFMLRTRRLILAGIVALLLEQGLQWKAGDSTIGKLGSVAAVLVTVALCEVALARRIALVGRICTEQVRLERFRRYFSPQVAQSIQHAEKDFDTGRMCEITVLFSDLRGFTAAAETAAPEEVLGLLNQLHTRMVEVIFEHGGTLDKYLGDGLMAYFGAPLPQADHAARAVRCALAMQEAFRSLKLGRPGMPPLRLSIGLHSGAALIGVMGARNRREFTAVGDTVNLASRMETLTRTYEADVILSGETARRTRSALGVRLIATVQVKGRSEPVEVYVPANGQGSGQELISPAEGARPAAE